MWILYLKRLSLGRRFGFVVLPILGLHLLFLVVADFVLYEPDQSVHSRFHPAACYWPCTYHWHASLFVLLLPEVCAIVGAATCAVSAAVSGRRSAQLSLATVWATAIAFGIVVVSVILVPDLMNAMQRT